MCEHGKNGNNTGSPRLASSYEWEDKGVKRQSCEYEDVFNREGANGRLSAAECLVMENESECKEWDEEKELAKNPNFQKCVDGDQAARERLEKTWTAR